MGVEVRGKNCKFVYSVLASRGNDSIFSFVYKEGDYPSIVLDRRRDEKVLAAFAETTEAP